MQHTLEGQLEIGIHLNGQCYRHIEVNLLTIGGECKALDVIASLNLPAKELTREQSTLVDLAYLLQQVTFKGVDNALITPKLLLSDLVTDDYLLIMRLIDTLRKKRMCVGESPLAKKYKE